MMREGDLIARDPLGARGRRRITARGMLHTSRQRRLRKSWLFLSVAAWRHILFD
jgi:hypothetical protein